MIKTRATKLIFLGLVEVAVGFAVAGGLLASVVPVLVRRGILTAGDTRGAVLVSLILVLCVGAALFRPGSALNRWGKS